MSSQILVGLPLSVLAIGGKHTEEIKENIFNFKTIKFHFFE